MNEFLSIRETGKILGVCRGTVLKHIRSGALIAYRVGRLVRIPRVELEVFVKSNGRIRPAPDYLN